MRTLPDRRALAPSARQARRFPLAFVVLATEDQRQGNPVDWGGLRLAESLLRGVSSATLCEVLEI